jgi:O-acetylhomoserine (thiol)-lyase
LRFEKAVENCRAFASFLSQQEKIKAVNYPGIPGSKYYDVSKRQFGDFPGAMLTFDFSTRDECFTFINSLSLIRRATNVYDNKSLIIHPASTIYCDFDQEKKRKIDVSELTVRLSLGIEDIEDLKDDVLQALNALN